MFPDESGGVAHAELRFGNGLVMLGTMPAAMRDGSGGLNGGIAMNTEEIDAHYERARTAGANITMPLETKDYGGKGYGLRDPEGNEWSIGSYAPGKPQ